MPKDKRQIFTAGNVITLIGLPLMLVTLVALPIMVVFVVVLCAAIRAGIITL